VWNVKIRDTRGNDGTKGEYMVRRWLDQRWHEHTNEHGDDLWNMVVEDMARHYTSSEYTSYPGEDQGQWNFFFFGRSGGWMGLEWWKRPGMDRPLITGRFSCCDEWLTWLQEQPAFIIRELYRAVRCMDHDFTRDKIQNEYCYHLNWHRAHWEETLYIDPLVDAMRTALWNKAQKEKGELCETR
jgi:hypothetical protein